MHIFLLSTSHGGAVREPLLTGAGDAGPENGGDGHRHNQGPAHTPPQPAGLGLLCWIGRSDAECGRSLEAESGHGSKSAAREA